ncbi:MAG: (Fe-S)-binding protein, partial [Gammaproteobacteria bacterium]|nr:(Fe-S)-binding protein [Gammaproteobacteria bacterium]
GDKKNAQALARNTIEALQNYDHVVIPSGSCAGMLIKHYPDLFADDEKWQQAANDLSQRTYELTQFLVDVLKFTPNASCPHSLTYHDSCSSRREVGVIEQPRQLLSAVNGLKLQEMEETEICCGFGGTFCVKYPDVSTKMVSDKTANIQATGAEMLAAGDMGCLMNITGRLKREGSQVQAYHIAEVLAGMTDQPGIGEEN